MCDVSDEKIKTDQSDIPVSNCVLLNSVDSLTFQF